MPTINQREASRKEWGCNSQQGSATESEIKTGSLQRIADALERIAERGACDRAREKGLERTCARLRAQVRSLKKRAVAGMPQGTVTAP